MEIELIEITRMNGMQKKIKIESYKHNFSDNWNSQSDLYSVGNIIYLINLGVTFFI